jgi:SET domain-containing protein
MDLGGYDLLVVDAMHKANFASRLCHSCTPNCATKVTAVEGKYMIGVYAIEDIREGEELTFNYHSVTEVRIKNESVLVGVVAIKSSAA